MARQNVCVCRSVILIKVFCYVDDISDGTQLSQIFRMPSTLSLAQPDTPSTHQALRIPSLAMTPSPTNPVAPHQHAGVGSQSTGSTSATPAREPQRPNVSQPMPFHAGLFGRNVVLSADRCVAMRKGNEYCNG